MQLRTNPLSFREDYEKINLDDFYINYLISYMRNFKDRYNENVIDENLKIFIDEFPDNIDNCLGIFHQNKNESEMIETIDIFFDLVYRDKEGRNKNRNQIELTFSKICDIFNNKSSFEIVSNEKILFVVFTQTLLPITAIEDSEIPRKDLKSRVLFLSSFQIRLTNCLIENS